MLPKKILKVISGLLLFMAVVLCIAYYQLLRPSENLKVDSISFADIESSSADLYPVIISDVNSIRDKVIIDTNVSILMSDGVKLAANVYRPAKEGSFPVIMSFTAYDKDKGPEEYPPVLKASYLTDFDLGSFTVSPWTTWEGPDPAFWTGHGYVVIQVDSRGFFDSEGRASLFDEQNTRDFHEAITWAGSQTWSNGHVALHGVSYLAISQWVVASNNSPEFLKAIIPWEGQTDPYREVMYHGGIPETVFTEFWLNRVRSCANGKKPLPPHGVFRIAHKNPWLLQRVQEAPNFDLSSIEVPALICASWSDHGLHSRGSLEAYKKISSGQKWLFTHGRPKWSTYYSEEALEFQKRFLDYFLKGIDNGMDSIPSVRLEVRESLDSFYVRYEEDFPLPSTNYQSFFLHPDGALKNEKDLRNSRFSYDWESEKATFNYRFTQDTEISGHIKLKLWVSTSKGSDMDLFAGINKLDRSGEKVDFYAKTGYKQGLASMGWLRVSERALDSANSTNWQPILSHDNPQKIRAGEPVAVEIEILASSTFFEAGESLQLVIQGKDFYEHPSLGHHYSVNRGEHHIHFGDQYDSHLLIPVIRQDFLTRYSNTRRTNPGGD
jgi:predicted acyl esterase